MVWPTGGGEATNPENMEVVYTSKPSWDTEEEGATNFPSWKGVDEYHYPVEPTLLSANFTAVFTEVASLLNSNVEWKLIINNITQEDNKVLGDKRRKNVKLHRLERSMGEAVSTFQSVVEAEQRNGEPQQKRTLEENENPARRLNQEHGTDKSIKR